MKAVVSTLRTFGVLLGLWTVLAVTGVVAGAVPGLPWSRVGALGSTDAPAADAGVVLDDRDGGVALVLDLDAGPFDPTVDAGEVPVERPRRTRFTVCPEPITPPSLAAVDVLGDERLEVVVGCGSFWDVLAVRTSMTGDPDIMRVARLMAPPLESELTAATGRALVLDLDGDGSRDLLLPFAKYGAGSASRGGGLFVLPRDTFGGFGVPRALAPIAAVAVAAGALDENDAIDIAVVHQANAFARLPSEVWVFSGSASPTRTALLRTGPGAHAIAIADLDRDRSRDIIVAASDEARVDVFFGDGRGAFPRNHTLAVPNVTAIAIGDLDGDRGEDAVLESSGIVVVRGRSGGDLEAVRLEGVPDNVRGIELLDVDADGKSEIVGWAHPALVLVAITDNGVETRTLLELGPGPFGPRRQRLVDLDVSDPAIPELLLLGVTAVDGPRSLELVVVPGTERGIVEIGEAAAIPDAPLMLEGPLPDALAQ